MGKVKLSIKLKNRLVELDRLKKAVEKMSTAVDCTKRKFKEINLILEELFTNVVSYGFNDDKEHDIDLSMCCDEESLMIRMEDDGEPFDITSYEAPDTKCDIEERCVGGLGIHMVKHFIDDCKYYREKGKNIVVLTKKMNTPGLMKNQTESK